MVAYRRGTVEGVFATIEACFASRVRRDAVADGHGVLSPFMREDGEITEGN